MKIRLTRINYPTILKNCAYYLMFSTILGAKSLFAVPAVNGDYMEISSKNLTLDVGKKYCNNWGNVYLTMQSDGNLVLYTATGPKGTSGAVPLWASNTNTGANKAVLQADGNLVVYDPSNNAPWASGTNGKGAAYLTVQEDSNLVIYDANNNPLWASGTNGKGHVAGGKPTYTNVDPDCLEAGFYPGARRKVER